MSDYPTLLVGDFNTSLDQLETIQALLQTGWVDLAQVSFSKWGYGLEPTCRNATRYSFVLCDSFLLSAFHDLSVRETFDFDSHPIMRTRFCIDCTAMFKYVWPHPCSFDAFEFDDQKLSCASFPAMAQVTPNIQAALDIEDTQAAFVLWSGAVENLFYDSIALKPGQVLGSRNKFLGRCTIREPEKIPASPVRVRHGRPGDIDLGADSAPLRTRQWLKQARRLSQLIGMINKGTSQTLCDELWVAIFRATGFRKSFQHWLTCAHQIHVGFLCPDLETLSKLKSIMQQLAEFSVRTAAAEKAFEFKKALDESFKFSGGKNGFKSIREAPLPEVTHLVQHMKPKLMRVRWSGPKTSLHVVNPDDFQAGLPLMTAKESWKIKAVIGSVLRLDRPISFRDACRAHCERIVHQPAEMSEVMYAGWQQYWNRDSPETDWSEFRALIHALPQWQKYDYLPLTLEDFRFAMNKTKKKSMKGACSWSAMELMNLPDAAAQALIAIFNCIEGGLGWPVSMMEAFVICLAKQLGDLSWKDVRPITVTSMLYRVWGRCRTHQLLKWIALQVPRFVDASFAEATNLMWARTLEIIDDAFENSTPKVGVVFDLVKAFNTFGREPIALLATHLGVPPPIVHSWMSALKGLSRRFIFHGSMSRSFQASTGVPEGCGLSVVAVNLLAFVFVFVVSVMDASACPSAYADNWAVVYEGVPELQRGVEVIVELCNKMKLMLSPQKSWVWATRATDRKKLHDIQACGQVIPVLTRGVELGADMRYSRQLAASKGNSRMHAGIARLRRIQRLPINRFYKRRLVKQGVWSKSLHGAEAIALGKHKIHRLRSAASKALGHAKCSQNPWLALAVNDRWPIDPQFEVLIRRVRLVRQFACKTKGGFAHVERKLHSVGQKYKGVVKLLRDDLSKIGWKFDGTRAVHDAVLSFDLLGDSITFVKDQLAESWRRHVCQQVNHRKFLHDISSFEVVDEAFFKEWSNADIALFQNVRAGALYTNDFVSQSGKSDDKCPLCDKRDSMKHRMLECHSTLHIRIQHSVELRRFQTFPDHTLFFGLFDELESVQCLRKELKTVPFPALNCVSFEQALIFTDGTCCNPEIRKVRMAAWAVTRARDNECNSLVRSGPLPGLNQCIRRAEILAGIVALAAYPNSIIFSDCLQFVSIANDLCSARSHGHAPSLPLSDRDLRLVFWQILNLHSGLFPNFVKVKAHQTLEGLQGYELFLAYHNKCADEAAKGALSTFSGQIRAIHKKSVKQFLQQKDDMKKLASFHLDVAKIFIRQGNRVENPSVQELLPEHLESLRDMANPVVGELPEVKHKYPHEYLVRLWLWSKDLKWAAQVRHEQFNDISWCELLFYFRCMCDTDLAKSPENPKRLILRYDALPSASVNEQVRFFGRAVRAIAKEYGQAIFPGIPVQYCKSMRAFGSTIITAGINCRPIIPFDLVKKFQRFLHGRPKRQPLNSCF